MSKFKPGQWVFRRGADFMDAVRGGCYRVEQVLTEGLVLRTPLGTKLTGSYDPQFFELDSSVPQPDDATVPKPTKAKVVPVVGKHDPLGIDQHAPGAKLDGGKSRPALVLGGFASAVEAMVKVGSDGARKYTDNGWKTVPNGKARYEDAMLRHLLAHLGGEVLDPESGSPHISHCMWNAAAIYELSK